MFTGPDGPVEVFFYWPEAVFGDFYWTGAIGSPLVSSPESILQNIFEGEIFVWICPCMMSTTPNKVGYFSTK